MFNWSRLAKIPLWWRFIIFSALALLVFWFAWRWWLRVRPARVLTHVMTFVRDAREPRSLSDPFGLAIDADGVLFISDGLGELKRVARDGTSQTLTKALHTPSFIALAADNKLIVADSGAHTIHRVDRTTGAVELLAGTPNQSGRRDGAAAQAQFNAPVGVAVNDAKNSDGLIFIADTYNDRICTLDANGEVKTLATGFHTPSGLVVTADGSLLVADTGHHRLCRVTMDGAVTTLAGTGEAAVRDGKLSEAAFDQPAGLAWRRDGALTIAEAGSATIRLLNFGNAKKGIEASVTTLAGGYPFGWRDGALNEARFQYPIGLAFNAEDVLFVADSGNGAVRALLPDGESYGQAVQLDEARVPPEKLRAAVQAAGARWPFYPFEARREIAGTFGEIRGVSEPNEDAWFHNGLDIPGAYGETVYAMYSERVTRLLAVEGTGETRERLRLPLFGYIHVRIGRDQNDQPLPSSLNVQFLRDAEGKVTDVRVPRGTTIRAGLAIGTLNRLNHVHLIAGPASSEVNALSALPLPGIGDTVKPVIERVMVLSAGDTFLTDNVQEIKKAKTIAPVIVQGRKHIIVMAYDQADGNVSYRRLGLYRLGYQILRKDGSPVEGFAQPRYTLTFDRLPQTPDAARLVYATGSQSGYTDRTIFAYQVTNELRDGVVSEGSWDTTTLAAGDYVVRVFAEDFFRNQTTRDLGVVVVK